MSDSAGDGLRDRIAYAIAQADGDLPGMDPASWDYELADAVIEALSDVLKTSNSHACGVHCPYRMGGRR